ncbi:hypothetical protein CFIMG_005806RAa [Ceratocystis fimbriata CBS 114723]|uniref:Uncharacterized protein n=1 Tax=Ceratocystis fimbriata CBS 114723 TaxID=1035309 RepID=A0A2C5X209_9PEZI|nr:hypothetical protein CFIMG_005806RAa [Ceratocystis fimbriata CBS 114723]
MLNSLQFTITSWPSKPDLNLRYNSSKLCFEHWTEASGSNRRDNDLILRQIAQALLKDGC